MVVIRINKRGELLNSKPCQSCDKVLASIGLDKIWYSTEAGFHG